MKGGWAAGSHTGTPFRSAPITIIRRGRGDGETRVRVCNDIRRSGGGQRFNAADGPPRGAVSATIEQQLHSRNNGSLIDSFN